MRGGGHADVLRVLQVPANKADTVPCEGLQAPRYDGHPMETGPLPRVWINVDRDPRMRQMLQEAGQGDGAACSVMGRHLARAVEAVQLLEFLQKALAEVDTRACTLTPVDLGSPVAGEGLGLSNAGRGELLHYVPGEEGRVSRYLCVVPSTWNFSPQTAQGGRGRWRRPISGLLCGMPTE